MTGPVTIEFLGGLGEVGRNCTIFTQHDASLMVDCGIAFDNTNPDNDFLLPRLEWADTNGHQLAGIVLTHGHLDHVGALPQLIENLDLQGRRLPIYGTCLSLALAIKRLAEYGLHTKIEAFAVRDGQHARIGPFDVETVPAAHSIPGACSLAISTSAGLVYHTGDFKLDPNPIDGRITDLDRVAALSERGIRLLLADSTNAQVEGVSGSESDIAVTLNDLICAEAGRRVLVACFASNLHRVQKLVDAATAAQRKVAFVGSSLKSNREIAEIFDLVDFAGAHIIEERKIAETNPDELVIITTGSQGETTSGLGKMAEGNHRSCRITSNDTIIMSSKTIPGNEQAVASVLSRLASRGAKLVTEADAHVHVSGHACQDELRTMLQTARPEQFLPVHGTVDMLGAHGDIALDAGISAGDIIIASNETKIVLDAETTDVESAYVTAA